MRDILARSNRDLLAQLAWAKVLLAFDYDGTLAPIVDDPARAYLRPSTRALLDQLARRFPCAVISGRAQHDAMLWLDGIPLCGVVGNHGLESWQTPAGYEHTVSRWRTILEQVLAPLPGVVVEDKSYSLAIHYRKSREKKRARLAIKGAVLGLTGARMIEGKLVINVLPEGAPHKGVALERLRERQGCDTALYVGDDETDEDVFALDQPGRLLTIRVGESRRSRAAYFIEDQRKIDTLLRLLLKARRRGEKGEAS